MNEKREEATIHIDVATFKRALQQLDLPDILCLKKWLSQGQVQGVDNDVMTGALLTMLAAQVGPKAAASGKIETTVQPDGGVLVDFRVVPISPDDLTSLLHKVFQKGVEQGVLAGSEAVAAVVNKRGGNINIQGVKRGSAAAPTVEIKL